MIQHIAFIGATGNMGKPVARTLHEEGYVVTALVRNEAVARQELPSGIALQHGDIRDRNSLDLLFAGKDAVYVNLNLKHREKENDWHAESDGMVGILQAAKKAGLKRIAFISSVVMNYQGMDGFNWWVFDVKRKAIDLIKASGIAYTIFFPSAFMENFISTYRRGNKLLLAGTSHHKMFFIAGEDFGKQVARSFSLLSTENKEYVVQGREGFTADEAVNTYIAHHTREKLKVSKAPLGLLRFLGFFSQEINYGYNIITALNNYPEKFESDATWKELGEPTILLKDFAQRT